MALCFTRCSREMGVQARIFPSTYERNKTRVQKRSDNANVTQEEEVIVEAVYGRPGPPEITRAALEWLLTQHHEEAEYFLRGSSLLAAVKREVEALLPMPISEEILPHPGALGDASLNSR